LCGQEPEIAERRELRTGRSLEENVCGPAVELADRVLEAAYHEAGHGVAMWLQETEIDHLELMRPDELRQDGLAGCVQAVPSPIATIGDAVDAVVEYLAGEAAFRIAWANGVLANE
jgi:hypothetical protein